MAIVRGECADQADRQHCNRKQALAITDKHSQQRGPPGPEVKISVNSVDQGANSCAHGSDYKDDRQKYI